MCKPDSEIGCLMLTLMLSRILLGANDPTGPASDAKPDADTAEVIPDLLKEAIHPFSEGTERAKFLRAGGVDGELSEQEFDSDKKSERGFARGFDSWPVLALFDANRNGTIDWLEARDYRNGLWTLIVAQHDKDRDGDLKGPERDEANAALAKGRTPEYFLTIGCCGQQSGVVSGGEPIESRVPPPAIRIALRSVHGPGETPPRVPSIMSLVSRHQRRKTLALREERNFSGAPESRWMPFTSTVTRAELDARLDPVYRLQLAEEMSESDWKKYKENIHRQLRWMVEGNADGIKAKVDMSFNYSHGTDAPQKYPLDQIILKHWLGSPPVHRLGFADEAISVRRMKPISLFPGGSAGPLSDELRRVLETEQVVLTLRTVTRFTPPIVYSSEDEQYAALRDDYRTIEINVMYHPGNPKGGPLYGLPGGTKIFDDPDSQLPAYVHSTGKQ